MSKESKSLETVRKSLVKEIDRLKKLEKPSETMKHPHAIVQGYLEQVRGRRKEARRTLDRRGCHYSFGERGGVRSRTRAGDATGREPPDLTSCWQLITLGPFRVVAGLRRPTAP